jgi:hypothetical protein
LIKLSVEELVVHYPALYHMAEIESWPSIRQHGLLSTIALLDLFEVKGVEREKIVTMHRPSSVTIENPCLGKAVIRDQIPMRESALMKCLRNVSPSGWYEFLNGRVFFWVTKKRVETLLNARAYRSREHLVLTIDTRQLLEKYHDKVLLSPINSGSTIYRPVKRGIDTFKKIPDYPFAERRRLRGLANAVAEMAFDYSIPDFHRFLLRAERRKTTAVIETIWSREPERQS